MQTLVQVFLHLDVYLEGLASSWGPWIYLLLFLIIFAETGLVFLPFLPGDSLLFAAGALCAVAHTQMNVHLLFFLLIVAAVLGDALNYSVGLRFGKKLISSAKPWVINKNNLQKTHNFFAQHGTKTIVLARFVPIVRTFAPFVAGLGSMSYRHFALFNFLGAILWVFSTLYGGYFFGNLPWVKKNFHIVILAIIIVSFLPVFFEFFKSKRQRKVFREEMKR
ncbi:MAG: DedA family protein [Bdellovibrionales bacterium]|nr:DedA family protein [Bdellovibrionales bacterium]